MYTRGQPGEADNRGESLVQKHMDLMQQQKEAAAMDKLRQLMPQLGDMVRALALSKAEWDIDQAVAMLRSFQVSHLDKVNTLNKRRKKLREAMEACTGSEDPEAGGNDGDSGSSSSSQQDGQASSSSSESEDDDRAAKRKRSSGKESRKSKKRSKVSKKESKRSRKHKRSSKDKDRDKKKRRRREADDSSDEEDGDKAAKRKNLSHTQDFGKHGFIRESDMSLKHSEFMLWATEVKGVNVELIGRLEEKELFKEYMEDFNTGTLQHRKYYNLEAYDREQAAKQRERAAKSAAGAAAGAAGDLFDARADEEAMRRARMDERQKQQQQRMAEAYSLLKHTDRAKDMREQELLRAEMTLAYKTGDRAKAQKLYERLLPDDQKK